MIRVAGEKDIQTLAKMAVQIFDNSSLKELEEEFCVDILKDDIKFFLKYENNLPVGFAQVNLRYDYVEGCETSPVGYLEGVFVQESFRGRGYAKELLKKCEDWAKSKGCKEFASDCEIKNVVSYNFHKAMNFSEANRIICFTKKV